MTKVEPMSDTPVASQGQQKYIADLLRDRCGNPKTCGDLDLAHGRPLDDWTVDAWIDW